MNRTRIKTSSSESVTTLVGTSNITPSVLLGFGLSIPPLLDVLLPASQPFSILYVALVGLFAFNTGHRRSLWLVVSAAYIMIVAQSALYLQLHPSVNLQLVVAYQAPVLLAIFFVAVVTHFRMSSSERSALKEQLVATQQELDQKNEFLSVTSEGCEISGFKYDILQNSIQVTDSLSELLGKALKQPCSLDEILNLLLPPYREELEARLNSSIENRNSFKLASQMLTLRKERIWVEIAGHPVCAEEKLIAVVGTFRNITTEKNQEIYMASKIIELEHFMQSLPGLVWQASDKGSVRIINESSVKIMNSLPLTEIGFLPISNIVHSDDIRTLYREWRKAKRSEKTRFFCSIRIIDQQGEFHTHRIEAWNDVWPRGTPEWSDASWTGVAVRADETGEAETAMGHTIDFKETVHELNNVLTSVMGTAENIESGYLKGSEIRAHAGTIIKDSALAARLISNLCSPSADKTTESKNLLQNEVTDSYSDAKSLVMRTQTVLVVDDDSSVRKIAARLLANQKFTVITASNAPQALEILSIRHAEIDFLLTDMFMSGDLYGSDLAAKTQELYPHIMTVLMSGYDSEVLEFFRPSSNRKYPFISKPFGANELVKSFRTQCGIASKKDEIEAGKLVHSQAS